MATKMLTGMAIIRLFRSPKFRQQNPKFLNIFAEVDKIKNTCCQKKFRTQGFKLAENAILQNPELIKKHLGVDKIELYTGNPKRLITL